MESAVSSAQACGSKMLPNGADHRPHIRRALAVGLVHETDRYGQRSEIVKDEDQSAGTDMVHDLMGENACNPEAIQCGIDRAVAV
jgi:hypothetical protein